MSELSVRVCAVCELRVLDPTTLSVTLDSAGWLRVDYRLRHITRPSRVFHLPFTLALNHVEAYGTDGREMVLSYDENCASFVVHNLATSTRVHTCEFIRLWRSAGVLIDLPYDAAIRDRQTNPHSRRYQDPRHFCVGAYTMEPLMTLMDPEEVIYTSRWLICRIKPTSVTYYSPAFRDREFKIDFGDWRLYRAAPPARYSAVADFRRGTERMLWCWDACIGVRTDLPASQHALFLHHINGAVFAHYAADHKSDVFVVPINHVLPTVKSDLLPPEKLPDDPPMCPARLLLSAPRGGVLIVPPLNSDTHPPVLVGAGGTKLYRIQ